MYKYQVETVGISNVSQIRQPSAVASLFLCSRVRMNIKSRLYINTCEDIYLWISSWACSYKNCFTNTSSQCCGLIIFVFTCENEYQVDTMYKYLRYEYQVETVGISNVSQIRQPSSVASLFLCSCVRMNIRSRLYIITCENIFVWISSWACSYQNCFPNTTSQCCGLIIVVFTCENEYQVDTMYKYLRENTCMNIKLRL